MICEFCKKSEAFVTMRTGYNVCMSCAAKCCGVAAHGITAKSINPGTIDFPSGFVVAIFCAFMVIIGCIFGIFEIIRYLSLGHW